MTELRWYSLSISSLRDVKVRVQSYVKACGLWEIGQARDLGLEFDFLLVSSLGLFRLLSENIGKN